MKTQTNFRFLGGERRVIPRAACRVFAHHSFAAEFDVKQPVTLKGTVTKVEWTNPHVWIYLDVTNDRAPWSTGSARTARPTRWLAWAGPGIRSTWATR